MTEKSLKIIVTGGNGQLGNELRSRQHHINQEWIFTDLPDLDLTRKEHVAELIKKHSPDYVVNCAAYTAVDKAETERDLAYSINADAAGHLASLCHESGSRLIHISTDFVFDGKSCSPINEDDITSSKVNHWL